MINSLEILEDLAHLFMEGINEELIYISFLESDTISIYAIISSLLIIVYNLIFYYQVISLVFSIGLLFVISGLYFAYLGGEFIGLTLILIYVGAILVLFLYFIMILDIHYVEKKQNYYKQVSGIFITAAILVISLNSITNYMDASSASFSYSDINLVNNFLTLEASGHTLYGIRSLDIIIAGLILLVGIFGVITVILTRTEDKKSQDILRQILNKRA